MACDTILVFGCLDLPPGGCRLKGMERHAGWNGGRCLGKGADRIARWNNWWLFVLLVMVVLLLVVMVL